MPVRVIARLLTSAVLFSATLLSQPLTLSTGATTSSIFGAPVTLTASISPSSATGAITFFDGATLLGVRNLSGGAASLATTLLPAGDRKLNAYYSGDASNPAGRSNVVSQHVTAVAATTFTLGPEITVGSNPMFATVADFNGDGLQDLAVAVNGGSLTLLLGRGDGTFQPPQSYPSANGQWAVATGDWNRDGITDIVTSSLSRNDLTLLLGNGDGTFQPGISYPMGSPVTSLAIGDFNRDGKADIAAATFYTGVAILAGNGVGGFQTIGNYLTFTSPSAVVAGDFDSDGNTDLATVSGSLYVLQGNGDGSFQTPVSYSTPSAYGLATGDFNGDGITDLATANIATRNASVMLGNGDGTFGAVTNYAAGNQPEYLAAARFTAGSSDDLVISNQVSNDLTFLMGGLQTSVNLPMNYRVGGPLGLAVGDFNRDGRTDIAVTGGAYGSVNILLGAATTLTRVSSPEQSTLLGQPFPAALQAIVRDTNGNPASGVPVVFSAPAAGASATLFPSTAITNEAGIAAVLATANTVAGSYTAIAQSGTLLVLFGLTNVAATPSVIEAVEGSPQSAGAGMPFPTALRARVRDAGGNPVAGATVTFAAPSTGASAGLSSGSAVTDNAGVAQALATANDTAGSYAVTASLGGLSAGFSLTNLPPTMLALAASASPSPLGATVTMSVNVTPSSAGGRVTFYDGALVLGTRPLSSGAASLSTGLLRAGAHQLRAYYSGDGVNPAGKSNVVSHRVYTTPGHALRAVTSPALNSGPVFMRAGDLNLDGRADLVSANNYGSSVTILLGNGDGTFARRDLATGINPTSVAIADFNLDGSPDIAVGYQGNQVAVFRGNGDGTFGSATAYDTGSAGTSPLFLSTGDFNRDGIPDLALVNSSAGTMDGNVSVLLGLPGGGFGPAATWAAGVKPYSIAIGDMDGDGTADIVVSNFETVSGAVNVLLGTGDGGFRPPVRYPGPAAKIVVDDFNSDGRLDIAGAGGSVLLGNGDGTLGAPINLPFQSGFLPSACDTGDFNGDGKIDIVAVGMDSSFAAGIYLGNGDGTFQPATLYLAGASPISVVLGDFNGDGRADAAVANYQGASASILLGEPPVLTIAIAPSGGFILGQTGSSYTITVSNPGESAAFGDVSVIDVLPAGVTAVGISGTGWMCTLATLKCVRSGGVLLPGESYPPIVVAVSISPGAVSPGVSTATLARGGSSEAITTHSAIIQPPPALTISKTHTGSFFRGQSNASYSIVVGNASSGGPTTGLVTVTDSIPTGLTLTSLYGPGWNCPPNGAACSRSDALTPGSAFPPITVMVNVAADAPSTVINEASVTGTASSAATSDATSIATLAQVTNPANGSILPGASVTFQWSSGSGVTAYWLYISGVRPGSNDLYDSGNLGGSLSIAVPNLPTDGRTVFVRLYSQAGSVWRYNDYTYQAAVVLAAITNPANGSTLSAATATFQWSPGSGVSAYWLYISAVRHGTNDLYDSGNLGGSLSATVTNLSADGRTLFVRLYSQAGSVWRYNDYTYTAHLASLPATMTSPANGTTLPGAGTTFQWSSGVGVSAYWLYISAVRPGINDVYDSGNLGSGQSRTVTGLPTDGRPLYVRLYSQMGSTWRYNDYSYTAATVVVLAAMTSPANGSTLPGASATFQWSAGSGVSAYWLYISSVRPGANDLYDSGNLGSALSRSVTGLPGDGRSIYVRLYSQAAGAWRYSDYTYQAATAALASMTSPANGATLPGATVTFQWSAGSGVSAYWLYISSVRPGANDVYDSGNLGNALSKTVANLPADGRNLYVRLYSQTGSLWQYADFTYHAVGP